jgi:hypothetical protein
VIASLALAPFVFGLLAAAPPARPPTVTNPDNLAAAEAAATRATLAPHAVPPAPLDLRPVPHEGGPVAIPEMAAAAAAVVLGDAAVLGGAYGILELAAHGAIAPTAENFRSWAIGTGVAALLVPPLAAALFATLWRRGPASGALWKAFLLATAGNVAALAVGLVAAPQYWAVLAVQLATMPAAASLGVHWGSARPRPAPPAIISRPVPAARRFEAPMCPDA